MKNRAGPIDLLLIPTNRPDADIVGFHAVEGRLSRVDRLPGESLQQMLHRALWMVTGGGQIVVYPRHVGDD